MISRLITAAALLCLSTATAAFAQTTHYVAPLGASLSGTADGSENNPWSSVDAALKNAQGGDTILLMDGSHGGIAAKRFNFSEPVTLESQNEKSAHVEWLRVSFSSNLTFRNLSVWALDPATSWRARLSSANTANNIVFDALDVRGGGVNSGAYLDWSAEQWSQADNGAELSSQDTELRNSSFRGVYFGIKATASGARVLNNTIDGFSGDGLRAGSNGEFRNNRVLNSFKVDSNHPDGIQAYASAGDDGISIRNLVIENNLIVEWTHPESHPLQTSLQGIGMFSGVYENISIQNNVVVVSHFHGISVYGARNSVIRNNTVVNVQGVSEKAPWLGLFKAKNDQPSYNVSIANNVAHKFVGSTNPENNIVFTNNSAIFYPATVFEDIANHDYRPRVDSGFVDTGNANHAPPFDIAGNARPSGTGPDRGAYEVVGSSSGGSIGGDSGGGDTSGGSDGGSTDTGSGSGTSSGDGSSDGGTSGGDGGSTDGTSGDGGDTGGGSTDTGSGDGTSSGGDGTSDGGGFSSGNGRGNNNGGGAKWAVPPGQGKRNR